MLIPVLQRAEYFQALIAMSSCYRRRLTTNSFFDLNVGISNEKLNSFLTLMILVFSILTKMHYLYCHNIYITFSSLNIELNKHFAALNIVFPYSFQTVLEQFKEMKFMQSYALLLSSYVVHHIRQFCTFNTLYYSITLLLSSR